jgi:hypothetical protein
MAVKKKTGIWLLLVAIAAITLVVVSNPKLIDTVESWVVNLAENAEDDDDAHDDEAEQEEHEPLTVRLDDELRGQVGIQVKSVKSSRFTP